MVGSSIPAVLEARANLQPNDPAFTYVDYQQDWAGVGESLTWSQLYRRTSNVAQQLKASGSTGDRAVVLAPQGLDYVLGSAHYRPVGSRFRCRNRWVAPVTSVSVRSCVTRRRPPFSPRPLSQAMSPSTSS